LLPKNAYDAGMKRCLAGVVLAGLALAGCSSGPVQPVVQTPVVVTSTASSAADVKASYVTLMQEVNLGCPGNTVGAGCQSHIDAVLAKMHALRLVMNTVARPEVYSGAFKLMDQADQYAASQTTALSYVIKLQHWMDDNPMG
jgi:hypothetical protein